MSEAKFIHNPSHPCACDIKTQFHGCDTYAQSIQYCESHRDAPIDLVHAKDALSRTFATLDATRRDLDEAVALLRDYVPTALGPYATRVRAFLSRIDAGNRKAGA